MWEVNFYRRQEALLYPIPDKTKKFDTYGRARDYAIKYNEEHSDEKAKVGWWNDDDNNGNAEITKEDLLDDISLFVSDVVDTINSKDINEFIRYMGVTAIEYLLNFIEYLAYWIRVMGNNKYGGDQNEHN